MQQATSFDSSFVIQSQLPLSVSEEKPQKIEHLDLIEKLIDKTGKSRGEVIEAIEWAEEENRVCLHGAKYLETKPDYLRDSIFMALTKVQVTREPLTTYRIAVESGISRETVSMELFNAITYVARVMGVSYEQAAKGLSEAYLGKRSSGDVLK